MGSTANSKEAANRELRYVPVRTVLFLNEEFLERYKRETIYPTRYCKLEDCWEKIPISNLNKKYCSEKHKKEFYRNQKRRQRAVHRKAIETLRKAEQG